MESGIVPGSRIIPYSSISCVLREDGCIVVTGRCVQRGSLEMQVYLEMCRNRIRCLLQVLWVFTGVVLVS